MNLDYLQDFWDIHDSGVDRELLLRHDFVSTCATFLTGLGVPVQYAEHTADLLYRSMSHPGVHYHTPVHPLRMFAIAESMELTLSEQQRLAIWFHDAIWRPDPHLDKETFSSFFMQGLLEGLIPHDLLHGAVLVVEDTSKYLAPCTNTEAWTVLDLDLAHFGLPDHSFTGALVSKEFLSIYSAEEVRVGRKAFLEQVLATDPIFRTVIFQKRLEEQVRQNLKKDIANL